MISDELDALQEARSKLGIASSSGSKPEKVFDMNDPLAFRTPYTFGNNDPVTYGILSGILDGLLRRAVPNRYFYYTKDTARLARTGFAGSVAYRYSLNDPNASATSLSQEQVQKLNLIERFAYLHRAIYVSLGAILALVLAGYIAYQYNTYENLLPTLLIIPAGVFGFLWIKILNVAEGASLKTLPPGTVAFGETPEIPHN